MKKTRILAATATGAVTLLALTGCMSVSMDITINPDSTANASYSIGYDKAALTEMMSYGSDDALTDICATIEEQQAAQESTEEDVTAVWTETDEQCILTATSNTAVAFDENGIVQEDSTSSSNPTTGVSIVKDGDNAVVTFDTASFTESVGDAGSGMAWDTMISDFKLNVTFPGDVSASTFSSSVSEDKHTVSWDKDSMKEASAAGESLQATGALSEGIDSTIFIIAGILLLLVVLALIVVLVLRRNGKASAPSALQEERIVAPPME